MELVDFPHLRRDPGGSAASEPSNACSTAVPSRTPTAFHALYDKLARSDVMWQGWIDVRTNGGAPSVDGASIGASIGAIEANGVTDVRALLNGLAKELRTVGYRPSLLRRVNIPKAGQPGKTRPLSIPVVRDRVIMAAAKRVLEPIFEADFKPVSFGFRLRHARRRARPERRSHPPGTSRRARPCRPGSATCTSFNHQPGGSRCWLILRRSVA